MWQLHDYKLTINFWNFALNHFNMFLAILFKRKYFKENWIKIMKNKKQRHIQFLCALVFRSVQPIQTVRLVKMRDTQFFACIKSIGYKHQSKPTVWIGITNRNTIVYPAYFITILIWFLCTKIYAPKLGSYFNSKSTNFNTNFWNIVTNLKQITRKNTHTNFRNFVQIKSIVCPIWEFKFHKWKVVWWNNWSFLLHYR